MSWFGERTGRGVFDVLLREPERVFTVLGKRFWIVRPCAWAKIGQEGVCEGLGLEANRWYIACSFDPRRPAVFVPVGEFFDVTAGLSSGDVAPVCISRTPGSEPGRASE